MATLVEVDTSEKMDQDEEVAFEFIIWIGGNKGILSLSSVISLSTEGGEGWLTVFMFFCGEASLEGMLESVLAVQVFGRGFKQTCFPNTIPSPPCAG